MSWDKLNPQELKAARLTLGFSAEEAGRLIAGLTGKTPARTWQRWESGDRAIPDDIDMEVYALISQRNECVEGVLESQEGESPYKYYNTHSDFLIDFPAGREIWFKLYQSVISHLFADGGACELLVDIEIDKESYIYKFFSRTRPEDLELDNAEEKLGL